MERFTTHLRGLCAAGAAALLVAGACPGPALAETAALQRLYAELADPDNPDWQRVQADIEREWSKSGSPTMDLLLRRGREAIESGDLPAAIEHLTALTDHAPEFAEGWNARASAYILAGALGPAVADIGRVLALDEHHFGALDGLGMILDELDRDDEALAVLRASLAIHPHQDDIRQAVERLERATRGTTL